MKMLKKVLIPVLLISVLMLTFTLTSCKKCEHEYGEWTVTKDATCTQEGTQERTCALCGETETQKIAATGHSTEDLLCGVCGEEVVGITSLFPAINPDDVSSLGVVVKDVFIKNDGMHYTVKLAELVVFATENGIGGYVDGDAILVDEDSELTANVSVYGFIDGDNVFLHIYNKEGYLDESYTVTSIESLLTQNPKITEALTMVETLLPTVEAWINDSLLPCFTGITPPEGTELPELTEDNARKAATAILDLFFTVKTTDEGYVVALDLSIIENTHTALNEKTIVELVDLIGGEGTFKQLEGLIPTLLNYSVKNLLEFINLNLGVDIPKLLTALDELAVAITGNPKATFEMLVGMSEGEDIGALLQNEEFLAMTVKDFLMGYLEITDEAVLNAQIDEIIAMLNTVTAYQLMGLDEEIIASIDASIDMMTKAISYEIKVGNDGKFVESSFSAAIEEEDMFITAVLTTEKLSINLSDGLENSNRINAEIIPGYTPTPDAKKEANIKAKLTSIPEISLELLENEIYNVATYPLFEDGVLVGAIAVDYSVLFYPSGDTDGEINIFVKTFKASDLQGVDMKFRCGGKALISCKYVARSEIRSYTFTSEMQAEFSTTSDLVINLYETSNDYNVSATIDFGNANIDFYYDIDNKEFVENYTHKESFSEDESIEGENCGDACRDVYICADCGNRREYNYIVSHGDTIIISSLEYDEASNTYIVGYKCECGEDIGVLNLKFEGDATVTPREGVGDYGDAIDFNFTVSTAGQYKITFSDATDGGYLHWYQNNSYIGTTNYRENQTVTEYLDFTVTDVGYFNFYFYNYEQVNSIVITITLSE